MDLPLQNNKLGADEIIESSKVLSALAAKHFTGPNAEVIKKLLSENSFLEVSDFFEQVFVQAVQKIDLESLDLDTIEKMEFVPLANEIASGLNLKADSKLSHEEAAEFAVALKDYAHNLLHDIAFPLIAAENPNAAVSAKNLLKRIIASLCDPDQVELSELYEQLDIENLPTTATNEQLILAGYNLGVLHVAQSNETDTADNQPQDIVLYCELTPEQALFLAHSMTHDYQAVKNWKSFYHLLKSNGKNYKNVIVKSNKIGLVVWILDLLHDKRTITGERFLRLSKGNGLWGFLQGFLIDSKTDQTFARELRKLKNESDCQEEAQQIIDEIFDPKSQSKIIEAAKKIAQNEKI